ncbi:MAG TPA: fumarylacetoacetate hydrolase family protein, partial [Gammaproteobacteria bacterium]|nr:fumarylacetoacetate hydrolase family protein [Gammaproteobacteria bacterium]
MRLVSFTIAGRDSFGILAGDGVIDAGARLRGEFHSLRDVLACGALNLLRGMTTIAPDHSLDAISFAPVIPDPAAKFLCVGVNYLPHIREMGREPPQYPVVFVRFADSLVGHGQPLVRPAASEQYDFEGELAVIIGRSARHVHREVAL